MAIVKVARILIVDDDPQFRRAMRLALSVYGHQIQEAADGREAVELMQSSPPDLVLLDWQMPRMNGEETCRAIRAISHVPVIVVSAMDRTTEARPYGVSRSLIKPVDIDALLDGIAFALMEPNR